MQIVLKTLLIRTLLAAAVIASMLPVMAQAADKKASIGYVRALDLINRHQ